MAYPRIAAEMRIEGRTQIGCTVDRQGRLRDCIIQGESPKALGFGRATLQLVRFFEMRPMMVAGRPVSGGGVRVPLRFALPDTLPVRVRPPTSPQALEMARSYASARGAVAIIEADRESVAVALETLPIDVSPKAIASEAAMALRDAVKTTEPELRDALARIYAARYTASQLQSLVRRAKSRGRAALIYDVEMTSLIETYTTSVAMRAGGRFCAARDCGTVRSPPIPIIVEAP